MHIIVVKKRKKIKQKKRASERDYEINQKNVYIQLDF